MVPLVVGERDKAMIASPCVVSGTDEAQHVSGSVLRCYDDEAFTLGNFSRHLMIGSGDFIENRGPIRIGVRPCELHTPLGLPFGWKSPGLGFVFCLDIHNFGAKVQKSCEL